ncbi:acyl-CoA thioesterase [Phormidium tenue]|uniref:Thioesterase n=1 Tax=Phormidium tenue NIES-30 TaxID=549789 RepID=A0A1U7J3K1_9CYAN|nr:acyl-CoA thioesterase [Phormidium tenue]MBD2233382.1 acyl-CoA thioesterase [Phormidium tenue FACHB-1052]OKH46841.1 thioesterase [Phormidium tenue NIES-30]
MKAFYHHEFVVPLEAIDRNGHVNNVAYVQWMQDVAVAHATSVGCTAETQALGATWVARSHQITYLRPAFGGDRLRLTTWITTLRKARSTRQYKFLRLSDDTVLATGATDWVFVDAVSHRPRTIPASVSGCFELVPAAENL